MSITFDLPPDIETRLRHSIGDLNRAAKEAALVELYRQDRLSQSELGAALGLGRLETEALLHKHHVTEDLPTSEEYDDALARLREMTDK